MIIKEHQTDVPPLNFWHSLPYFAMPALGLYLATHWCIPLVQKLTFLPIVVCWFICGGLLVFLPLFLAAFILYRLDGHAFSWRHMISRFRLHKPDKKALGLSLLAIVLISALTFIFMLVGEKWLPNFSSQPSFMTMRTVQPHERWILCAWLPMFFFNIAGEGLYWRGYVFPRQQAALGGKTWLVHGFLWWLFHLPFGGHLLFILLPIIFITSFIVQVTRSTWSDIIIHTVINGSGFMLIALGLVH